MTKIIGLTGGIGTGKTTAANYFASKGIPIYIADEAAKTIMNDPKIIKEIQNLFEENIQLPNGFLDRKLIRQLVFSAPDTLKKLNEIIHPKVKNDFENWVQSHKNSPFVIKEVAILFETKGHLTCDATILITAPLEIRIQRVLQRDQTTRENILQIIHNQLSEDEKIKLATYVVQNDSLDNMYKNLDKLIDILSKN